MLMQYTYLLTFSQFYFIVCFLKTNFNTQVNSKAGSNSCHSGPKAVLLTTVG